MYVVLLVQLLRLHLAWRLSEQLEWHLPVAVQHRGRSGSKVGPVLIKSPSLAACLHTALWKRCCLALALLYVHGQPLAVAVPVQIKVWLTMSWGLAGPTALNHSISPA